MTPFTFAKSFFLFLSPCLLFLLLSFSCAAEASSSFQNQADVLQCAKNSSSTAVDYSNDDVYERQSTTVKAANLDDKPDNSQLHKTSNDSSHISSKALQLSDTQNETDNANEEQQIADDVENHSVNTATTEEKETNVERISRIARLLQHSRDIHRKILYERDQNEKATAHFQRSLKRLSDLSAARANTQKALHKMESDVKEYRRQLPLYARTLDVLHRQAGAAILEINRLRNSKYTVMHEKALLQDHFRHRGLEAWVQNYLKGSVNPLVAGAVVEGTADVVEPMLDGIEKLAAVNEDIARRMSSQLRESVPVVEKPFYSGFVTYTVLLFPLVLVTSVLLKIKRSLTRFSAGHFIILGNFYFAVLSGGCFIATLLGSVDVLLTFRHVNLGLFDLVMVVHGILYLIHLSIHAWMTFRVGDKALVLHTALLLLVGSHFFIHSYLHAIHNEDPHVDKRAYAIYTGIFTYILYNWTVKHIRMSVETGRMKLNNKSISVIEDHELAAVAVNPGSSGYAYPCSSHGMQPFMAHVLPEDGISHIGPTARGRGVGNGNYCLSEFVGSSTVAPDSSGRATCATMLGVGATEGIKADDPKDL